MKVKAYLDFIKIEHTLFALPFAYAGAVIGGNLNLRLFILILTAFTGLRTAAMTFNRIIDREIDAKNPRTAKRHLPAGIISLKEAYAIAFVSLLVYFVSAALINKVALELSPIPAIVAYVYPYLKRYTSLCHYVLGLNLAFAPLGGWVAVTDSLDFLGKGFAALLLSIAVVFWVAGFDMIYSLQDVEFDRKEGLHSVPAKFGERAAMLLAKLNHAVFFALTAIVFYELGILPLVLPIAALLIFEHFVAVKKDLELAFFHTNAAISATLLASIFAGYVFGIF